jgi:pyrroline-5-carboxylate reductase
VKIGFIGSGNMAAAMARGWASSEDFDGELLFTDGGSGRAEQLAQEVGGKTAPDNGRLATEADLIVLAIKPAQLGSVAMGLTQPQTPVLSILGATSLETLGEALPGIPVARVMPNLPVEVNRGVLCYAAAPDCPGDLDARNRGLLAHLGEVVVLEDDLIDAATAVMGCSPAYVALLAESLEAAAVDRGLDPNVARRMVAETVAGTGELLGHRDAAGLRKAVASPGGSTEKGLDALRENGFQDAVRAAVDASLEKMGR